MKILVLYQYFGTPLGSWSTRMYEFTRRWVRAGHQVTVITAPYEKSDVKATEFISRSEVEGVKLVVINSGDSNRDSFLVRALKAIRFSLVSSIMALREPCDIVLASSGPITVGFPALLVKIFRGKKMIFEIRDLWPDGAIETGKIRNTVLVGMAHWFEKVCYQNSSLVVACSPGMENSVQTRFPGQATLVIPNASDVSLFNGNGVRTDISPVPEPGEKYFIYAGSLGFMDHGRLMIEAMKHIEDPEIKLVIIGDGAERKELEMLSEPLGKARIRFLGLLPKKEVVPWLRQAVAALVVFKNYPVLQTSSPNKLFDAFAAGLPVIHNTSGWIKNLVDSEACGVTVDPDDARGLASAMTFLYNNDDVRMGMAENASRLARTTYDRDILSERYLSALTEL